MPRPLQYSARRVVALTEKGDELLIKIADKKNTRPAELARVYVEQGIRKDLKLLNA